MRKPGKPRSQPEWARAGEKRRSLLARLAPAVLSIMVRRGASNARGLRQFPGRRKPPWILLRWITRPMLHSDPEAPASNPGGKTNAPPFARRHWLGGSPAP